jgi:hypothetical protein
VPHQTPVGVVAHLSLPNRLPWGAICFLLATLTVIVALLAVSARDQRTEARAGGGGEVARARDLGGTPRESWPDVSLAPTYEVYRNVRGGG